MTVLFAWEDATTSRHCVRFIDWLSISPGQQPRLDPKLGMLDASCCAMAHETRLAHLDLGRSGVPVRDGRDAIVVFKSFFNVKVDSFSSHR